MDGPASIQHTRYAAEASIPNTIGCQDVGDASPKVWFRLVDGVTYARQATRKNMSVSENPTFIS
jgi:hypothetical protein